MASITVNQGFGGYATFNDALVEIEHGHTKGILKGVLAALAIITVGVLTLAMPALRPASDQAEQVAAEQNAVQYYEP